MKRVDYIFLGVLVFSIAVYAYTKWFKKDDDSSESEKDEIKQNTQFPLTIGSKGPAVAILQKKMYESGTKSVKDNLASSRKSSGEFDGIFGQGTLKAYQAYTKSLDTAVTAEKYFTIIS